MNRRQFLGTSAAALAWSRLPAHAAELFDAKPRVGLIGTGWYGKCDLFRLIQVAPVEVVSLCDVDKQRSSNQIWHVGRGTPRMQSWNSFRSCATSAAT